MRRRLAIVLGALIVLTAIAVAAMTRSTPSPSSPAATEVAAMTGSAPATGSRSAAATTPAAPVGPGADAPLPSVVAAIDKAMKDLDLIRPARQKLAEDFTVKTADGGSFRLSEQRGKVVLVNFWATWCPPCLEEMPAMQRLLTHHGTGRFALLAISVDADPRVVTPFLTQHRFTFTVGVDPKMELANTYGVRALPASFLVDREGHLAALALGPRHWDNNAARTLVDGMSR